MKRAMARAWWRYKRGRLANRRGWAMFGRLLKACIARKPDSVTRPLIRWSNRYYRVSNGANPWRPYRGY